MTASSMFKPMRNETVESANSLRTALANSVKRFIAHEVANSFVE